ncbi:hypothetical protein E2P81_ATG03265 [Venturia nashicola]|nr:hypothetical protein E2P81_ATG03265 [Venturia nashicola]
MKLSTATVLTVLLAPLSTLACRQLACSFSICSNDPNKALEEMCNPYRKIQDNSVSLVGRDGCGYHKISWNAPWDGVCPNGTNLITGSMAIWRATDIIKVDQMGDYKFYLKGSLEGNTNIGFCWNKKNVDC